MAGSENKTPVPPLNHEHERLRRWFSGVKFRKCLFGGADERDVWKKLGELQSIYEAALSAERARYDALLAEKDALKNGTEDDHAPDCGT